MTDFLSEKMTQDYIRGIMDGYPITSDVTPEHFSRLNFEITKDGETLLSALIKKDWLHAAIVGLTFLQKQQEEEGKLFIPAQMLLDVLNTQDCATQQKLQSLLTKNPKNPDVKVLQDILNISIPRDLYCIHILGKPSFRPRFERDEPDDDASTQLPILHEPKSQGTSPVCPSYSHGVTPNTPGTPSVTPVVRHRTGAIPPASHTIS